MQNCNESGRSMIEMLGVLSIMGVIMYGAVAGINFGIDMYKINATLTEVEELAQGIVDIYSWNRDSTYNKLTTDIVCANDAYPCINNNMTNQWGGGVGLGCASADCSDFQIVYEHVPEIACERLKTEPSFQNVCVEPSGTCSGGENSITFYSRGSEKCKS